MHRAGSGRHRWPAGGVAEADSASLRGGVRVAELLGGAGLSSPARAGGGQGVESRRSMEGLPIAACHYSAAGRADSKM